METVQMILTVMVLLLQVLLAPKKSLLNPVEGVFKNVVFYDANVLDENGNASISDIVAAIDWAIKHEVDIINMSFGIQKDDPALHEAIKKGYEQNIIFVAAAGNNLGFEADYPARYHEVLSISSIDKNLKRDPTAAKNKEDTDLEVSNLNVQNDRIIIESKVSTYNYDVDTTLEIQPEENTAQYNITYEENGDLIEKEYDLNINVIDDENFIIEFIDKETGEITIYDSSVVSASAVPYVAYIIGSQVVRLAIKGLAKKSIKVASNMGKILKHNSRGVLFEGNASKGWKHIKNGHILGKGAKKGDTLFPKNLSESQIKNIIMESLQKGTYKGQAANGYKSYEYNLNKYGINKMKVIVDKDGMIVTAYPLSGKSVIKVK